MHLQSLAPLTSCNPPLPSGTKRTSAGLTLIEILVVISIVAVLVLLVFTGVEFAREKVMITKSLNNQRQIFLGGLAYAADNNGRLADHKFDKVFPWRSYAVFWENLGGSGPEKAFGNLLKGKYLEDPRMFHSPIMDHKGHSYETFRPVYEKYLSGGGSGPVRAGYYYNPDRERDPQTGAIGPQFRSLLNIAEPSSTVMVMDILFNIDRAPRTIPSWHMVMADGSARTHSSEEVLTALEEGGDVGSSYGQFLTLLDTLLGR